MQSTHLFLVILVTVILIAFAEYQKLRKITWILLIGCVTYILLTIEPEKPLPISDEYNELNKIDSSNITEITNHPIEYDTDFDYNIHEHVSTDKMISDKTKVINKIQNLDILTIAIATNIVEKTPIGVSRLFLNDIDTLFCFTAVDNPFKNNKTIHIWKYNGQDYLKYFIRVGKAPYWRCWSRITIRPEMIGDWQVIVTDTVGNYLDSIEFSIIPTRE